MAAPCSKLATKLTPGTHVMNGVPVRLDYLADSLGDIDYWWVTTTFVDYLETRMMAFNRHAFYKPLHSRRCL